MTNKAKQHIKQWSNVNAPSFWKKSHRKDKKINRFLLTPPEKEDRDMEYANLTPGSMESVQAHRPSPPQTSRNSSASCGCTYLTSGNEPHVKKNLHRMKPT